MSVSSSRVLVVDDNARLVRALARILLDAGHQVDTASDGTEALEKIRAKSFDAVVSDIKMPNMTGVEFLRAVREFDLDVPVILMTGAPELETAAAAVEYGAFRYLSKPVETSELEATVRRAVLLHGLAHLKRQALDALGKEGMRLSDKASLESHYDRALARLWVAYQPIFSLAGGRMFAYEALVRSDEPSLANPAALLDTAGRLDRIHDIGRAVRHCVGERIPKMPADALVFVNMHPQDLLDDDLLDDGALLSRFARRVILEVTERASLDAVTDLNDRIARIRRMGYRLAVDDLGAGYAGLSSLARLEPEFMKLDMSLIRDVHLKPLKRHLVQSMAHLARELGIWAVAEGVERSEELETLAALGLDLVQGYHVGRPERELVEPTARRLLPALPGQVPMVQ